MRPARLLECLLWLASLACATLLLSGIIQARAAMKLGLSFGAQSPAPSSAGDNPLPPGTPVDHKAGVVIGRLEISGVALSVPVLDNFDPDTLKRGVGHIPGTALPGGLGNLGLAGHRDTFLRAVRNVKPGMEADVITAEGRYRYHIDSFEIVTPEQVEVLDIRGQPEMTLITCYPFDYIGPAPKRFVIHAHLLSLEPG